MNWTGGRLSRHSRACGSLNQRQKQHFAKVQNNLRDGTKKRSPLKVSIFDRIEVHHPETQQSSIGSKRHGILGRGESPPVERRNGMLHYTANRNTRERTPIRSEMKREIIPDDDILSATPQPWEKRKRELSVSLSEKESNLEEEHHLMSEKRRKLLLRGDWVGINIQRPLQMTFTSPRHGDRIGRRRKITDGHRAHYSTKLQSTITSPFTTRCRNHSLQNFDVEGQRGAQSWKSDVRIFIGNRVVPPGISSSTAPSRVSRGYSVHRRRLEQSQTASSDVMLLDNEEVLERALPRNINEVQSHNEEVEAMNSDPYREYQHPSDGNFQDDSSGQGDERLGGHEEPPRSSDDQHVGTEENSYGGYHHQSYMQAQTIPHPRSPKHSMSPIVGTTRFPQDSQPVFSSSSASMQHPIPKSWRVSLLLRSDSSEIADSTVAQIGKMKPIVPSSQALDNEIWETWMAAMYNQEWCGDQPWEEDASIGQSISISPGNSTTPAHQVRRVKRQFPPQYKGDSLNTLDRDRMGVVMDRTNSIEDLKSKTLRRSNLGPRDMDATLEARAERLPVGFRGQNTDAQTQPTIKPRHEAEPDDLWRRFVFGTNSDGPGEIDHDISKPSTCQEVGKQNLVSSSLIGNPSPGMTTGSTTSTGRRNQDTYNPSDSTHQSYTPGTTTEGDSSSDIAWNPPTGAISASDDDTS